MSSQRNSLTTCTTFLRTRTSPWVIFLERYSCLCLLKRSILSACHVSNNGLTLVMLQVYANMEKNQHDKDSVHVLETSVVAWTRQIKDVLRQDSETVLSSGTHPGPSAELEFWNKKSQNLNSIHEQLSSEKVKKVLKILEVTKSTYFPAFNRLCKEVAQARMEANDNKLFLSSLEQFITTYDMRYVPCCRHLHLFQS